MAWWFNCACEFNPQALSVIADTEKANIPSCKLQEQIGAVPYKETDELIWWEIKKIYKE